MKFKEGDIVIVTNPNHGFYNVPGEIRMFVDKKHYFLISQVNKFTTFTAKEDEIILLDPAEIVKRRNGI
tara:strand:+ start:192 stop:398 length:207 start_codon:yes stop_codon:yes gene_type:complete